MEALEKELFLDINERDKKKIIEIFELGRAIQLPVLDGKKVTGILDLFSFFNNMNGDVPIGELMETDIAVAGENRDIFSFSNSRQQILPFVDENGNYLGFVNRILQKCYLPSKEYMQIIEENLDDMADDHSQIIDHEKIKSDFAAIIESNYDGIYITVEKGTTLSINSKSKYVNELLPADGPVGDEPTEGPFEKIDAIVNVVQNIQRRNEISVSDSILSDRALIRIVNNKGDWEKIRNELNEAQKLAEKYQNELEFLRWEQTKPEEIIAQSEEMKKVINLANRVSKVDSTVLIQGQSGVGKEVLCKLIHNNSDRKSGPFIKVDCGAIPENLLESELFGYEEGSFTGAKKGGKVGLIELANGGTLFLDEIGEMPLNLQVKLLRMLQDREIMRLGGKETIPVDFRIIAATNINLEEMVQRKKFREDLYYRLNVVPIKILPLKERREDIKPLIEHYLNKLNKKYNRNKQVAPAALKKLIDYEWPGNVRELENIIEYLVVTTNSNNIATEDLPVKIVGQNNRLPGIRADGFESMKQIVERVERNLLCEAMKKSASIEEMGKFLKLDRSTVSRKLKKYKIEFRS